MFMIRLVRMHVLPVHAWVLSSYSGILPPSKNMLVRLRFEIDPGVEAGVENEWINVL